MLLRLSTITLISVALSAAAFASDLKIVSTSGSPTNGHRSTVTRYIQGQRSRTEGRNEGGWAGKPGEPANYTYGPPRATIFQCDMHRVLELNLQDHEYTLHELDDQGRPNGGAKPIPISTKESGGTLTINVETIDTGERKQIFGRTARHVIRRDKRVAGPGACGQSGETESDGWYTDLEEQNGCMATPKARAGVAIAVLSTGGWVCKDKIEVRRTGTTEMGFPLKLKTTSRDVTVLPDGTSKEVTGTFENEVTELSKQPLDPALFELPAGFTQVTTLKDQPPVPASVAIRQWWERLKRSVRSWFG
jgi:hypothetical protein